ncbi:MAG: SufD family Fe-S cluster assembly protein [Pyrodictiaceae archaeon]
MVPRFPSIVYEKARKGLSKRSPYGPDIDLDKYLEKLVEEDKRVGQPADISERLGPELASKSSYMQVDGLVMLRSLEVLREKHGVLVTDSGTALEKIEWAKRYFWSLIDPGQDKYTAVTALYWRGGGYFIYVPPGVKLQTPIYACLVISRQGYPQIVHNIIVVDEGAEAHIITGCMTSRGVTRALHIGVTEIYLARSSKLTFTMIHSWGPGVHARPRTAIRLGEDSSLVYYYITSSSVESLQSYPKALLMDGSSLISVSIIVSPDKSYYDTGFEARLSGRGSSAQLISRIVGLGSSINYSRLRIIAEAPQTKGYSECSGLQLSEASRIHAIPELVSTTNDADLGHEASIGRISEEELVYLMSRGLSEEEALRLVVQGFVHVDVPGLPNHIKKIIDYTTRLLAEKTIV